MTATAGTPTGSFLTLGAAIAAINAGTHQGAIVITVNADFFESATSTLNDSGAGSARYNSILIRTTSTTGVAVQFGGSGVMYTFNGARNVTIRGAVNGQRRLTFRTTSNNGEIFAFTSSARNIRVDSCILQGTAVSGTRAIVNFTASGNSRNITFDGNAFTRFGGQNTRTFIFMAGGAGNPNENIRFTNNHFYDWNQSGSNTNGNVFDLRNGNNNILIANNHFFYTTAVNPTSGNTSTWWVNVNNATNVTIRDNVFGGSGRTAGNAVTGTATFDKGPSASNNYRILPINVTSTSGSKIIISNNRFQAMRIRGNGQGFSGTELAFRAIVTGGAATYRIDSNRVEDIEFGVQSVAVDPNNGLEFIGIVSNGSSNNDTIRHNVVTNIRGIHPTGNEQYRLVFSGIHLTGTGQAFASRNVVSNFTTNSTNPNTNFTGIQASRNTLILRQNKVHALNTTIPLLVGIRSASNTYLSSTQDTVRSLRNATATGRVRFIGWENLSGGNSRIQQLLIDSLVVNSTGAAARVTGFLNTDTGSDTLSQSTIRNLITASASTGLNDTAGVIGVLNTGGNYFLADRNVIHTLRNTNSADLNSHVVAMHTQTTAATARVRLSRNRMYNLQNASSGATTRPSATGIVIAGTACDSIRVLNNMIALGHLQGTATQFTGIWNTTTLVPTTDIAIVFNSVVLMGTANIASRNTYGLLRGTNSSSVTTRLLIANNLLYNQRKGLGNHYAIGVMGSTVNWAATLPCSPQPSPDFNAYYTLNAAAVADNLDVARSFTQWQTDLGVDLNTIDISAIGLAFADTTQADLHLTDTHLQRPDGKTLPLPGLTLEDFDGDFRRSPDIGADEVELSITFTGAVDDNWHNPNNWNKGIVPNCGDVLLLPAGKTIRVYTANGPAYCYKLTVAPSATLILENNAIFNQCWAYYQPTTGPQHFGQLVNNGEIQAKGSILRIAGKFTDNGTFEPGTSRVILNTDTVQNPGLCIENFITYYNSLSAETWVDGTSATRFYDLFIANNGECTVTGPVRTLTVGDPSSDMGQLNLFGTGFLALNGSHLTLEGDLAENTGTLTGNTNSNLRIYGQNALTGTLKFTLPSGNILRSLELNRPNGLAALGNSALNVSNSLRFDEGILRGGPTGAEYEVHLQNHSPTALVSYSPTSYLWGRLRRAVNGTHLYHYPVGNATHLQLLSMQVTVDLGVANVAAYFNPANVSGTTGLPLNESGIDYGYLCTGGYWTLQPNTSPTPGAQYDLSLAPQAMSCTTLTQTFAKRANSAAAWTFGGSTNGGGFTRTGFADFSEIALVSSDQILPVELLAFTARVNGNRGVDLNWQVGQMDRFSHFEVERALASPTTPQPDFRMLGLVAGYRQVSHYGFEDVAPAAGRNYYRLRMVDMDGSFQYSPIVEIALNGNADLTFQVFPNPVQGRRIQLHHNLPAGMAYTATLINLAGQTVLQQALTAEGAPAELPVDTGIPAGLYTLLLTSEAHSQVVNVWVE